MSDAQSQVLNKPQFLLLVIVLALAIVAVFPKDTAFDSPQTSFVSGAYLKAWASHLPQDKDKTIEHAVALTELGDFQRAASVLEPLIELEDPDAERLMRQIQFHAWELFQGDGKYQIYNALSKAIAELDYAEVEARDLKVARGLKLYDWLSEYFLVSHQIHELVELMFEQGEFQKGLSLLEEHINTSNVASLAGVLRAAGFYSELVDVMLQYPESFAEENYHISLLEAAKTAGRSDILALPSPQFSEDFEGRERWLGLAIKARIALSDLEGAMVLVNQQLVAQPDNIDFIQQRRQIALWMNDTEQALQDGEQLFSRFGTQELFVSLVDEALASYQYQRVLPLYKTHIQQQALGTELFDKWMKVFEWLGEPEKAVSSVLHYESLHGRSKMTLAALMKLYEDMVDMPPLAKLWPDFRDLSISNNSLVLSMARALAIEGQYQRAVIALLRYRQGKDADDDDYWRDALGNFARKSKHEKTIVRAYKRLLDEGALELSEQSLLASLQFSGSGTEQLEWYWQRYQRKPSLVLLQGIAKLTKDYKRESYVKRLELELRKREVEQGLASIWLDVGYFYAQRARRAKAEKAFRQAIAADPQFDEAYQALGWLNLSDDESLLRGEG